MPSNKEEGEETELPKITIKINIDQGNIFERVLALGYILLRVKEVEPELKEAIFLEFSHR